jgi:DegV family protein with EDD domain
VIKILTDSNCSLPDNLIAELGILVVPVYVSIGGMTRRYGRDISRQSYYTELAQPDAVVRAHHPTADDFKVAYYNAMADGPGTLLVLLRSGVLSGAPKLAQSATYQFPHFDIRVFDTRQVAVGVGMMAAEAARMAQKGAAAEDILVRLNRMRERMEHYIALDSQDYILRGGFVGRTGALLGSLVEVKPLLTVKEGKIVAHSRHRRRDGVLQAVRELVHASAQETPDLQIGVSHAGVEEVANRLAETLCTQLSMEACLVGPMGPSLAAHAGPGAISVAWCPQT